MQKYIEIIESYGMEVVVLNGKGRKESGTEWGRIIEVFTNNKIPTAEKGEWIGKILLEQFLWKKAFVIIRDEKMFSERMNLLEPLQKIPEIIQSEVKFLYAASKGSLLSTTKHINLGRLMNEYGERFEESIEAFMPEYSLRKTFHLTEANDILREEIQKQIREYKKCVGKADLSNLSSDLVRCALDEMMQIELERKEILKLY